MKFRRLLLPATAFVVMSAQHALAGSNVETMAGTGNPGNVDGTGTDAVLNRPHGMTQTVEGVVVFADRGNHQIRGMLPISQTVYTLAGSGERGFADGSLKEAKFNQPVAVAADSQGNIYVADRDNHRIRKIGSNWQVSTVAGNGSAGYADGFSSDVQFNEPYGVALDETESKLLVADYLNHAIRVIDLRSGEVSTLAGNGENGLVDGAGTEARFNQPYNISRDEYGDFFVPDQKNHAVRRVTLQGEVVTIAGTGEAGFRDGATAQFNNPTGVATLDGKVYVADRENHRIRMIDRDGIVTTLAGDGTPGGQNGDAATAQFNKPLDVIVESQSRKAFVSEDSGHRIRSIR
jgi:DNA-binding beta-propeller fold protein YncE